MHLICEGPKGAGPTVLFEAGAFGFSADWGVVQEQLAAQGLRACAYDRAGMGLSDPGPQPRDGLAVVGDLERLLAAAHEKGPFILVGHSMAGLYLRLFANRNPRQGGRPGAGRRDHAGSDRDADRAPVRQPFHPRLASLASFGAADRALCAAVAAPGSATRSA